MNRIHVTGNAGAGKTTLASVLAEALMLPAYSLDQIVWQPGWRKTSKEERKLRIQQLIESSDQWVIEGVSHAVMEAADTVIFLDVPRHVCLLRCAQRNYRFLFRSRPELPDHCPEILIVPALIRIILEFPKTVRPVILNHIQQNSHKKTVLIASGNESAERVLQQLGLAHDTGITSQTMIIAATKSKCCSN